MNAGRRTGGMACEKERGEREVGNGVGTLEGEAGEENGEGMR